MFIVALFAIAKLWKQPKVSLSRRMKRPTVVHSHYGIVYSSEKDNRSLHITWMTVTRINGNHS